MFSSVRQGVFFHSSRRVFFAQAPQRGFRSIAAGAFCSSAARAWTLCSRSSREGFSFLLPEQKKRNKENSPSALLGLLRHFSPLNKKNSLRSNSFLFFTLRKAPSLHAQKVRPDLCAFSQHRFARWGVMFSFFASLVFLSSRAERRISFTSTPRAKRCALQRGLFPASVEEREEKSSIFR